MRKIGSLENGVLFEIENGNKYIFIEYPEEGYDYVICYDIERDKDVILDTYEKEVRVISEA